MFLMKIGFVLIINQKNCKKVLEIFLKYPIKSQIIGKVIDGNKEVIIR